MTDLQRLWATYLVDYKERHPLSPWWRKGAVYDYEGVEGEGWVRRDGCGIVDEINCREYDPIIEKEDGTEWVEGCRGCHHHRWVHAPGADITYDQAQQLTVVHLMALIDRTNPLPCPEPACGQVWAWPDGSTIMVQAVAAMKAGGWGVQWPGADQKALYPSGSTEAWPPPGAHLVNAVGGGPWSPPDTPEEP